jgi:hypothetical protein
MLLLLGGLRRSAEELSGLAGLQVVYETLLRRLELPPQQRLSS